MTKHKTLSLAAIAVMALAFATGCDGPGSKTAPAQQAAGESDVVVKGAFDHADGGDPNIARKPDTPAQVEVKKKYSPYAQRKYPTRVFFGDTHHHTANSGDAFMGGNRLSPEQATASRAARK